MSQPSVWVPSSEDDAARAALPVARELARLERATLHLMRRGERRAASEQDGAVVHEVDTDPASAVLEAASEASVIVTSTRDAADPPGVGLGRAARALLVGARCPVVLVRPEHASAEWALEELLVPHDGTPATSAAICPAAELARKIDAQLFALHVAGPGVRRSGEPGSLQAPHYVDQPQHEWPEWASEFVERVRSLCPVDTSKVRFFLGHGEPADEILRVATSKGVDLIVVAWHGALGAQHAETFKELLRRAPCPIMVLRTEPE